MQKNLLFILFFLAFSMAAPASFSQEVESSDQIEETTPKKKNGKKKRRRKRKKKTKPPVEETLTQKEMGGEPSGGPKDEAESQDSRPDKRLAFGLGLYSPDIVPLEAHYFLSDYLGLRFFFAPPLTFNVSGEVPAISVASGSLVKVASGTSKVDMEVEYGPHLGAEAKLFPFAGSFFLAGGLSYRSLTINASGKADLYLCAANDLTCGIGSGTQLATDIEADATVKSSALLLRASLGWFWKLGPLYMSLTGIGVAVPMQASRDVDVKGRLTNSSVSEEQEEQVNTAIASLISQYEKDAEKVIEDGTKTFDTIILPIIGFSLGIVF